LVGDVVALLSTLRADHGAALGFEHIRSGFLAVDQDGTPLRPQRWSDMWRTHCQTAGVPVVTLHSARHTSVTTLRAAGVSDDVVGAWHGHDETIMRAVYSHPDAVAMVSAGRTLSDVLGGNR
jgi:integrase